jgi:predicted RNA binding protein YcfA (HicA-like mRNA interferase family)
LTHYTITESGTGRQRYRILADGQLHRYDDGRVHVYSERAADKALAQLLAAQLPMASVLDSHRRTRLDGVSWEDHDARYGTPPSWQVVHRDARTIVVAHGGSYATYKHSQGQLVSVSITHRGELVYDGSVEALEAYSVKSKHAAILHPYRAVGAGTLTRWLVVATD